MSLFNTKISKHALLLILAIGLSACASQQPPEEKKDKEEAIQAITHEVVNTPELKKQTGPHPKLRAERTRLVAEKHMQMADMAYAPMVQAPGVPYDNSLAGENYAQLTLNGIKDVLQDPVSTFSIDVDTGS